MGVEIYMYITVYKMVERKKRSILLLLHNLFILSCVKEQNRTDCKVSELMSALTYSVYTGPGLGSRQRKCSAEYLQDFAKFCRFNPQFLRHLQDIYMVEYSILKEILCILGPKIQLIFSYSSIFTSLSWNGKKNAHTNFWRTKKRVEGRANKHCHNCLLFSQLNVFPLFVKSLFRNNLCKDDSTLFSIFLHGLGWGLCI
jgi:hypothetical protein